MGSLTLIVGGQKAGKSSAALRLATSSGRPCRVITPARAEDVELAERIARHKRDRAANIAVAETFEVATALAHPSSDAAIVDALDTWLLDSMERHALFAVGDEPTALGQAGELAQEQVLYEVDAIGQAAIQRDGPTFIVAGTIGMGLHGPTPMARRYEDLHGLALQRLGRIARQTLLIVAGQAVPMQRLEDLP